ncbi:hypothetical protein KSC_023260 [Ktedonobacter sp. SOSP1-52]|uniref:hypothetical protein n=1 Tax=Ktedonobacter sp. SOSP1-52 TaxID=2778366 RepID=UPI00191518D9|nr:hypothetical protein [Ktedonobacter sp. SOSP1-52]GHO63434.1 hypothetical protein KSC_023260 [Ktedonobacter sp. SOSP1-52]
MSSQYIHRLLAFTILSTLTRVEVGKQYTYRSRLGGHEYTQFPSSFEKGWSCEHIPFNQVEECLSILGTTLDDWTFQSEPLWLPSRSDDGLCLAFLELIKAHEGYKVFVNLEPQLHREQFEPIADVFFVPVYA